MGQLMYKRAICWLSGENTPSEMPSRLSLQSEKRSVLSGLPCSLVSSAGASPCPPSPRCRVRTYRQTQQSLSNITILLTTTIGPSQHDKILTSFSDIIPGTVCSEAPSEMTSTSSGVTSCRDSWELASISPSWATFDRLRLREPAGWGRAGMETNC